MVKIWLIVLFGLLWHLTFKGKGAPKIHRCPWSKRNDKSERVSKNLLTCISKLYTRHGIWDVTPWPPSINKWWWILNKGSDEIGKREERRKKARKQTNITNPGSSINPSDRVSSVLGYLFIAKLSLPRSYISCFLCKLTLMSSLFFQTFLEMGWQALGSLVVSIPHYSRCPLLNVIPALVLCLSPGARSWSPISSHILLFLTMWYYLHPLFVNTKTPWLGPQPFSYQCLRHTH